ncbi:hypothetical protein BDN72DRAFT_863422 [Pluteus cervinus]|uniref:Uncharacterized protein n=1 Tax=Pluteus cervinus TaxID=181527 RepID=A0ACD3A7P1_9AGAR|nr:hypothetical protein BDN72DRAFT_863422 [Pluteus cervinus]
MFSTRPGVDAKRVVRSRLLIWKVGIIKQIEPGVMYCRMATVNGHRQPYLYGRHYGGIYVPGGTFANFGWKGNENKSMFASPAFKLCGFDIHRLKECHIYSILIDNVAYSGRKDVFRLRDEWCTLAPSTSSRGGQAQDETPTGTELRWITMIARMRIAGQSWIAVFLPGVDVFTKFTTAGQFFITRWGDILKLPRFLREGAEVARSTGKFYPWLADIQAEIERMTALTDQATQSGPPSDGDADNGVEGPS